MQFEEREKGEDSAVSAKAAAEAKRRAAEKDVRGAPPNQTKPVHLLATNQQRLGRSIAFYLMCSSRVLHSPRSHNICCLSLYFMIYQRLVLTITG